MKLHSREKRLLGILKATLEVGTINKQGKRDMLCYRVRSVKDLAVIIAHFDKYPLITQKRADYLLFKRAVELINRKEHLTIEGLHKIVAIKASINNGLPASLKEAFPNIIPVERPFVDQEIKDPHWLAGFVDAEGSIFVVIQSRPGSKLGCCV
jgi:hypothetical protein